MCVGMSISLQEEGERQIGFIFIVFKFLKYICGMGES